MKRIKPVLMAIIGLLLLFSCTTLNEKEHAVAVELSKVNVVYYGIENPINVAVTGVLAENIELSCSDGELKKTEDGYLLLPEKVEEILLTIKVGDEVVGEKKLRVLEIPNPQVMVAGKNSGMITKKKLLDAKGPEAKLVDFSFDIEYEILSFTVSSTYGGYTMEKGSSTGEFNDDQKKLIEKVEPGNKIYIEDVTVIGPDQIERKAGSAAFIIQERKKRK